MLKLVLHSLRMRRIQSVSVALTVAVSVAVLLAFGLVFCGVQSGVQTSKQRIGAELMIIPTQAEQFMTDEDLLFSGAPAVMYMDYSVFEQVAALPEVEHATYQFFSQTLDESCCSASHPTRLIGFDPSTDWLITPWINSGSVAQLTASQVVLGSNVDGYTNGKGQIHGNPVEVLATLDPTGTELDNSILVDIDVARGYSKSIGDYDHFWQKYGQPENIISTVLLEAKDGQNQALQNKLSLISGIKVLVRSLVVDRSLEQLQTVFSVMVGAGIALALASLLQLFARFFSMTWERKSEFALYRAFGATTGNLRVLIGAEAIALTAAGIIAGLVGGAVLYFALLGQLGASGAFPFIAPNVLTIIAVSMLLILLFMLMTLAAVVVPLRQIARIDPSTAMQQTDIG